LPLLRGDEIRIGDGIFAGWNEAAVDVTTDTQEHALHARLESK
jgi:hypothetical protein